MRCREAFCRVLADPKHGHRTSVLIHEWCTSLASPGSHVGPPADCTAGKHACGLWAPGSPTLSSPLKKCYFDQAAVTAQVEYGRLPWLRGTARSTSSILIQHRPGRTTPQPGPRPVHIILLKSLSTPLTRSSLILTARASSAPVCSSRWLVHTRSGQP